MTLDPWAAVRLSLLVATASTLLSAVPATAVGWWLARRDPPGKALFTALLTLPMVLPPVVVGLGLLHLFGRRGPLGAVLHTLGVDVVFSPVGAVLAAATVGFPLFVLSARTAFLAVDPRLEALSATLGDPPAATFRRVTLPLAAPGLAAGAVLAFARALGEFGATVVLAGNLEGRTRTIPLAVYSLLDTPAPGPSLRPLLLASVALSVAALLGYEALLHAQRRRLDG